MCNDSNINGVNKASSEFPSDKMSGKNITAPYTYIRNGNVHTINGISFEMVPVESGRYIMGDTDPWSDDNFAKPAHPVDVASFEIGKTQVTQALWETVMGNNPSDYKGDDHPVENVSWSDCQEFISRLNDITGLNFRMPTEEEWEFAARGGIHSKGYRYAGGDDIESVAWMDSNSGGHTHGVGRKKPNELGIFDMTGNVEEWTSTPMTDDYTENSEIWTNEYVCRGGAYDDETKDPGLLIDPLFVTYRSPWDDCPDPLTGLRLTL